MGIKSFWETLGDGAGERVNLFQIASDHISTTGKPYRIAVDTPYWLFKNLDDAKVEAIREHSNRASNPNEKAIIYRLMRFAIHGIQVCLVFDGPGRPIKRGKEVTPASHGYINERLGLLKEAAHMLGVAVWDAPAEAEAECANMLRLKLVDAVWSEDSDVFLFRADALLRFHYETIGKKDNVMAEKYTISSVKQALNHNMDWQGALLFAVLVGGDYAVKGLPGCGPKLALEAISKGFGQSLVETCKRRSLSAWRERFREFLVDQHSTISLPADFPNEQVLQNYINPTVSTEEQLRASLQWNLPIGNQSVGNQSVGHQSLKEFIHDRFNFSVQEYILWVVRMLVARTLLGGPGVSVDKLELEFKRGVSTKRSGNIDLSKISFLITPIVPDRGLLETWWVKDTIDKARIKSYVYEERIECDIPDSIINHASPDLLRSKKASKPSKPKTIQDQMPDETRRPGRPQGGFGQPKLSAGTKAPGEVDSKRKRGRPRKHGVRELPDTSGDHRKEASSDAGQASENLVASKTSDEDDEPNVQSSKKPRTVLATKLTSQNLNKVSGSSREPEGSALAGQSLSQAIDLCDD